jgi:indolepyruvate ferredoxin oxidoreductase
VARGRTIAVIDRDVTPTAAMLQRDLAPPDVATLEGAIIEGVGADRVVFVDAKHIAEVVFAEPLLANVILLGVAFQRGGLPLTLADIDRAMERQGRAAADNREAFEWGRWVVHDPAAVSAVVEAAASAARARTPFEPSTAALERAASLVWGRDLPAPLHDLLVRRAAQAIDYQNTVLAKRYLELVGRVAAVDDAEHGWVLTRAVADSWFKLLTYKDEYEVARLHLEVDYDRIARELGIDGPYSVTYHLHPPFLRRLGLKKKLPMGKPYEVGFRALRSMKRLRGTPFDVFGWDPDRRTERALIAEYERLITEIIRPAAGAPYDARVRLAESPQAIKGYAAIKEEAVVAWRARVAELRGQSTVEAGTRP